MKLAYSLQEFLTAYGISRTSFYNLVKSGHAPKMMYVGRRRIISIEAIKEWQEKMESKKAIKYTPSRKKTRLSVINTDCFLEDE